MIAVSANMAGRTLTMVALALTLAACGSSRFGGRGPMVPAPQPQAQTGVVYNAPAPEDEIIYAPGPADSGVIASPLPPPSGGLQGGASGVNGGSSPNLSDIVQPSDTGIADPLPPSPGTDLASRGPVSPQALGTRPTAAPNRSSMVGSWTARDATGASCRVQLSSTPALDLYRASASGCSNRDLAAISAWDLRDGEVYLYQRGGTVAARLRQSGGGYNGVLTKSGATVSIAR